MSNDMCKVYKETYNNTNISIEIRKDLQYSGKLVLWLMTTSEELSAQSESLNELVGKFELIKQQV